MKEVAISCEKRIKEFKVIMILSLHAHYNKIVAVFVSKDAYDGTITKLKEENENLRGELQKFLIRQSN